MKTNALVLIGITLCGYINVTLGVVLSPGGYVQTFDGIGTALPDGWSIRTGNTSSSLGTPANWSGSKISWSDASGGFRNVASADGLPAWATTEQTTSADRALGIRQTATFGDPGAAFVFSIDNTVGYGAFTLTMKAQMLDVEGRSTTWNVQYQVGSGTFTTLGTYTDPGVWGSTILNFDLGTALNDLNQTVTFRVVALSASTGLNSRDTFAIDDFALGYSAVPEPTTTALAIFAGAALGIAAIRRLRQRNSIRTHGAHPRS